MDVNDTISAIWSVGGEGASPVNRTGNHDESDIFERLTYEQRKQLEVYKVFAYTIGSLILVSNLIVVISSWLIMRKGRGCKSTYALLGNVSLADALIGANVIIGISVRHDAASELLCVFQIGLIVSPTMVSIFTVGLIAVDRYIYIVHGLHYRQWINKTRVRLGIILTWLLGIILGFMPATGWAGDTMEGRKCWYIAIAPPGLLALISIIGILPIIISCILYSIILFHALRKVSQLQSAGNQSKRLQNHKENELRINRGKIRTDNEQRHDTERETHSIGALGASSNSLSIHTIASSVESGISSASSVPGEPTAGNKFQKMVNKMRQSTKTDKKRKENDEPNKWRAIKVVLLTSGSFVCTWVPYFIVTGVYLLCDKETDEDRCHSIEVALASPLAILGLINSLLNPLIYAWWHRGFMNAIKKLYCGFHKACISRSSNEFPTPST